MRMDFGPDSPGENTRLAPERAPRWMRSLLSDVTRARAHPDVRGARSELFPSPCFVVECVFGIVILSVTIG